MFNLKEMVTDGKKFTSSFIVKVNFGTRLKRDLSFLFQLQILVELFSWPRTRLFCSCDTFVNTLATSKKLRQNNSKQVGRSVTAAPQTLTLLVPVRIWTPLPTIDKYSSRSNDMKILPILLEKTDVVTGTNCARCKFTKDGDPVKVDESELNKQGGVDSSNEHEMELARKGDLVTLPGDKMATVKVMCRHPKIKQYVTERMCCAYWDAPGVYRAFGKKVVGSGKQ